MTMANAALTWTPTTMSVAQVGKPPLALAPIVAPGPNTIKIVLRNGGTAQPRTLIQPSFSFLISR